MSRAIAGQIRGPHYLVPIINGLVVVINPVAIVTVFTASAVGFTAIYCYAFRVGSHGNRGCKIPAPYVLNE